MKKTPSYSFNVPWFIFDLMNLQLIVSPKTIPNDITDKKDIILAEKVRNLSLDLNPLFIEIEDILKNNPISIIPQILATTSFMRQTYENAVDLADLVV